jgi:hypothetical protein
MKLQFYENVSDVMNLNFGKSLSDQNEHLTSEREKLLNMLMKPGTP